jgi:hypothetical protein
MSVYEESEVPVMRRLVLSFFLIVGVGLIVTPLAMSMFSHANDGQKMVNDFRPIMQPANVQKTADYYNNTFTKLRPIALAMNAQTVAKFDAYLKGFKGMEQDAAKLVPALATQLHMSPAQVQQFIGQRFPAMAAMLQGLPQMEKDFGGLLGLMSANVSTFKNVPPGLDHYKPLVDTMQANVGTYASVDALPRMGFFPWFFVIPGIMLVLAAAYLLVGDVRPDLVWPKLGPNPPTTTKPLAH